MFSHIIFDLDGTLIDSADDIIICIRKSIEKFPEIGKINIDRNIIGPPIREIINNLIPNLDEEVKNKILNYFKEYYYECNFDNTKLINGVLDLLNLLKRNKIKTFIATNKPIYPTQKILSKFDLTDFNQIVTIDSVPGKYLKKNEMIYKIIHDNNLNKEETIYVGDAVNDINAAKKNKIKSIGFLGGYGNANEIINANPNYFLRNMAEIIKII